MDTAVAFYGAVLATLIAVVQGVSVVRKRVRLGVDVSLVYEPLGEDGRAEAHGTPVQVSQDGSVSWHEVSIRFVVRNMGGVPVQVVAVVMESYKEDGALNISQFSPAPLPHVLDPVTRTEIVMQKEHLDMLDNITFLGVVDALGRRYAPRKDIVMQVVQQSWNLPTRVAFYRSRLDTSAPPVLAYQNRDGSALFNSERRSKRSARVIAQRAAVAP